MTDPDLCYISATDAITRFRRLELSPVDVIEAQINRLEQVNPDLNALVNLRLERARDEAELAARAYRAGDARPLEGVTIAIKDLHPLAGEVTTRGSVVYEHTRSDESAPTVQRLVDAGAIVVGRSTTPELGYGSATHSRLWGITRNPWNRDYSPGGSSGGAAAAVAAGMTTLADGSDHGGSIRTPASCCGVVGYKPPYGRNPLPAGSSLDTFMHYGPITRTVEDAALMQDVTSGAHPDDIASLRERVRLRRRLGGVRGWKVAYSIDLGMFHVDSDVRANTEAALEVFERLGCTLTETKIEWPDAMLAAIDNYYAGLTVASIVPFVHQWGSVVSDYLHRYATDCTHSHGADAALTVKDVFDAAQVFAEIYRAFAPIVDRHHVFVCPTTAIAGVPADYSVITASDPSTSPPQPDEVGWQLTWPFNVLSRCPVISVPSGFGATGVPTGIQIVARSFDDTRVFRAAAAFESERPWLLPDRRSL